MSCLVDEPPGERISVGAQDVDAFGCLLELTPHRLDYRLPECFHQLHVEALKVRPSTQSAKDLELEFVELCALSRDVLDRRNIHLDGVHLDRLSASSWATQLLSEFDFPKQPASKFSHLPSRGWKRNLNWADSTNCAGRLVSSSWESIRQIETEWAVQTTEAIDLALVDVLTIIVGEDSHLCGATVCCNAFLVLPVRVEYHISEFARQVEEVEFFAMIVCRHFGFCLRDSSSGP